MDSDFSTQSHHCGKSRANIKFVATLLFCIALHDMAGAQGVLMSQPQVSTTPQALRDASNKEMEVFNPEQAILDSLAAINPFVWGPVMLHPHVSYSLLYGTGIQSSTNSVETTVVQTFSPGMTFSLGSHWTLDYTPTWTFYSNDKFQDTPSHSVSLAFGTSYRDWVLGFSQSYSRSSSLLVETGTQTDQASYGTSVNASYNFNSKWSLDLSASQSISDTAEFANSRQWSTMEWLNYHFAPRLDAGVGIGGGYVDEDQGSDQVSEQLQARINWRATDKTSIALHGGLDSRQFLDTPSDNLPNPIFGLDIQYQPFQTTQVSLGANRSVSTSYFGNQVTEGTSVHLGVTQRLFKKFSINLGGGYSTTDYVSSDSGHATVRSDESYSFNAGTSYPVLKRGSASLSYQLSQNTSSDTGFTYTSSQVSFEIGFRF